MHIDHVFSIAPNIQLSGRVSGKFQKPIAEEDLSKGLIVTATNIHEKAMQPFPDNLEQEIKCGSFFFGLNM